MQRVKKLHIEFFSRTKLVLDKLHVMYDLCQKSVYISEDSAICVAFKDEKPFVKALNTVI